jgi:electron transport complex protein RnfB
MLYAIAVLTLVTLTLAALLLASERRFSPDEDSAIAQVEAVLPHIQCGQCGYAGCRPYAAALVRDNAPINLCPPGGDETVERLAALLGAEAQPIPAELGQASLDRVARIEEALCIGCNLCQPACPVDAILGIPQMLHTVLKDHCTGCERCLPPCPVDCISMVARDA